MNGLQVLDEIKKKNAKTPVIILSAQDKIAVAFDCLKRGAVDYFMKGTESTFTTVLTSILKINELQRLRKNEKDYKRALVVGSVLAIAIIALLLYK
jgi:DNA-binding NtrC family response regulator